VCVSAGAEQLGQLGSAGFHACGDNTSAQISCLVVPLGHADQLGSAWVNAIGSSGSAWISMGHMTFRATGACASARISGHPCHIGASISARIGCFFVLLVPADQLGSARVKAIAASESYGRAFLHAAGTNRPASINTLPSNSQIADQLG
jgi:hypothetical protein